MGGFLVALRLKGERADEIAGCAEAMREHVVSVRPTREDLVDTAGTGGDGARTFNISTAAALVAAAAGAGVAKHGNRAVSSASGSADVLEALGFRLDLTPPQIERSIDELGFGFLFAQAHHPAMRHAAPVRRELATRTVFNVLGPLTNPAGARAQVVGVYAPELVETIASVLAALGARHAYVVHGAGGIDELSPAGPNLVCEVVDGDVTRREIDPRGLRRPALLVRRPCRRHAGGERGRRHGDPGGRRRPQAGGRAPERRWRDRGGGPCRRPHGGLRPRRRGGRLRRRRRAPGGARRLFAAGGRVPMSHALGLSPAAAERDGASAHKLWKPRGGRCGTNSQPAPERVSTACPVEARPGPVPVRGRRGRVN